MEKKLPFSIPDSGFKETIGKISKERRKGSGFEATIQQEVRKKKDFNDYLRKLSRERNELDRKEIINIIKLYQELLGDIKQWKKEIEGKSKQLVEKLTGSYLEKIIKKLDLQDFWFAKFGTAAGGGVDDYQQVSDQDSLYYMTKNGISLRLKRANISDGLEKVIQPPYEKIIFDDLSVANGDRKSQKLLEVPTIGASVEEYSSPEFMKAVEVKGQFDKIESSLMKYRDSGRLVAISGFHQDRKHEGDIVNQIFWQKEK